MNNKRLLWVGIAFAVLLVGVLAVVNMRQPKHVTAPDVTPPPTASVQITEDGFVPATLKVKVGTVVIWTNVDSAPHRIAANPYPSHTDLPELDSKTNMATDGTYRFTFDTPGTFHYHDELNPKTNGTVIVE